MKLQQRKWTRADGWIPVFPQAPDDTIHLVLLFGATAILREPTLLARVRSCYPRAHLLGCSTAGEICSTRVSDDSLVATAIGFDATPVRVAWATAGELAHSYESGRHLADSLPASVTQESDGHAAKLAHVFVLSDGLHVNGSDLVRGLTEHLPAGITITGGLAGDGARFEETLVLLDHGPVTRGIAALGFYGTRLKIGFGSLGGWDPFGPERIITRSEGNILYELDGEPALGLYKKYLGEHAAGLPATGLLFPLSLRSRSDEVAVVRTILSIDEKAQSLTFAGDVPLGAYARLMKANFNRLIDGAVGAAKAGYQALGSGVPDLAILISCVGRKLVLKQRIEEEVEAVREVFGERTVLTGFYSYGEISPFTPGAKCELHNQTMTITALSES